MIRQLRIQKKLTDHSIKLMDRYLTEISHEPLISPDEEVELAEEIRSGGEQGLKARNKLVNSNLRFVVSVAKQYQGLGLSMMDLIDEGNMGLVTAAQKFDPTHGFKFISYAVWWIRQSILKALSEQNRIVKLPMNRISELNKIHDATNQFILENYREPSVKELAEFMNVEESEIRENLCADTKKLSIDAPVDPNQPASERISDHITSNRNDSPDSRMEKISLRQDLESVMEHTLRKRDREIIKMRFGLNGEPMENGEIAYRMKLNQESVRQIIVKSLKKMKSTGVNVLIKYTGKTALL